MPGIIRWILLLFLSAISAEDAFSQVVRGCRSGGTIYKNPPSGVVGWSGGTPESCPINATSAIQHTQFVQNAPGSPSCPIGLLSLGGSGTLVDYRLLNCPIDGWISLLFLPVAVAGLFSIRKF